MPIADSRTALGPDADPRLFGAPRQNVVHEPGTALLPDLRAPKDTCGEEHFVCRLQHANEV